ncbi:hypothetical protein [uncultured Bacteroides sp.]|uniref:hypothetical protein n=1 Tax=uncultured Bacteroides sp. TaxID=162156 RepID=UPI00261B2800|nr:hypothetical protein [uncultured Bacteroides sp.]
MAAYFIDNIKTYSNTNNKGRVLQQYIGQFKQRLVKDDLSMDALKADIENEIERLNKAYPRTQPLVLNVHQSTDNGQWTAWVDGNSDKIVFLLSWETVLGTYEFAEKNEKDLPDNHITINQIDLNNWEYDDDSNCKPVAYEINLTFCNEEYTMYFTVKDLQRYEDGWDLENSGCEGSTLYFDSVNKYFENYPNEADRLIKLMKECWDDFCNTEYSPYNYMGIKK